MAIRIIVNGAHGRMGQLAVNSLKSNNLFEVVAASGKQDDLAATIKQHQPDLVVDLTTAAAVYANSQVIIANGVRPVIGTSGLTAEQISQLQEECQAKQLGGIIAPNFSLGAVLVMKYAQAVSKYFSDVEIIEMHHQTKLDSPSGTALRMAELIAANIEDKPPIKLGKETIQGSRGANYNNIPIHAIRLPGLIANLQVMFGGVGETITLRHDTISRECFMPGLMLACQKVLELNNLVYGLENLLDLN